MEWIRLDPLIAWMLRASIALLLGSAAIHKLRDRRAFLRTLAGYEIVPSPFTVPAAIALIAAELSIAAGLLASDDGFQPAIAAATLLLLYSTAIGLNLLRGRRDIDCGCLGPAHRQPLSVWLLVRNALLIVAAGAAGLPVSERGLNLVDGISLLGGLTTLVLLFNATQLLAAQTWRWPERENTA